MYESGRDIQRVGRSTGTCAAAAAGAALGLLLGSPALNEISVGLPGGGRMQVPVYKNWLLGSTAFAEVVKDAGGDPDVTDGAVVVAAVELTDDGVITVDGGAGVGRVTRPGLKIKPGEAAINPVPRRMIEQALATVLASGYGARAIISVPEGERLAARTMNGRLGIEGGISILGTSGLVRPMSDQAWADSLIPQLDQAAAAQVRVLIMTPGGAGERIASRYGFPAVSIVQCANYFDRLLSEAAGRGFEGIIILAGPGKMLKLAGGFLNTHSRWPVPSQDILQQHMRQLSWQPARIGQMTAYPSMGQAWEEMDENERHQLGRALSCSATAFCRRLLPDNVELESIIIGQNGGLVGYDVNEYSLWRRWACRGRL